MHRFLSACALSLALIGCTSDPLRWRPEHDLTRPLSTASRPRPIASRSHEDSPQPLPTIAPDATPDAYIRAALLSSPELEAAYQRWRAQSERVPQVGALPDPRLSVGFFANEVETRVGPQQARIGISQQLPWFDALRARQDAAAAQARASWVEYLGVELRLTRLVASALYELRYLDRAIEISRESLDLLRSFEDSVRARYRVGSGTHPNLVRVQVELGMNEDYLRGLETSRPMMVAKLNAILNRPHDTPIELNGDLPVPVLDASLDELIAQAGQANPELLALSERAEAQRSMTDAARFAGRPELTVGVERVFTDDAINPTIAESGDDPLLLSFSVNLPIWREKYDAGVRESIAQRLALVRTREQAQNNLIASISEAHFRYADAQRRESLYEQTLIPKAGEALQTTLGAFRTGESGFTDLLDAQRTLLEFELAIERVHADRGIAMARLRELVGIVEAAAPPTREKETEARP